MTTSNLVRTAGSHSTPPPEFQKSPSPEIDPNSPSTWRMPHLEDLQRKAVNAPEGPTLVLGGPGTGKTHVVKARAISLIRGGAVPSSISILTFNSQAARNINNQFYPHTGATANDLGIFTGTMHSMCSNYLRKFGYQDLNIPPNFSIWDKELAELVFAEIIETNPISPDTNEQLARQVCDWHHRARSFTEGEAPRPGHDSWTEYAVQYEEIKRLQRALDFPDLITKTLLSLQEFPHARKAWTELRTRHLLIDEFQDVNDVHYSLIKALIGPTKSITIAGDPNQCIYGFLGAKPQLFALFERDHHDLHRNTLIINHRSTRTLVDVSITLNNHENLAGLINDYQMSIRPPGPNPTIIVTNDHTTTHSLIASEVLRLHHHDGVPLEDILIISRYNSTLDSVQDHLKTRQIPHTRIGENDSEKHSDYTTVLNMLRLVSNPEDHEAFRKACDINDLTEKRALARRTFRTIQSKTLDGSTPLLTAAAQHAADLPQNHSAALAIRITMDVHAQLSQLLDQIPPPTNSFLASRTLELYAEKVRSQRPHSRSPSLDKLIAQAESTNDPTITNPRTKLTHFLEEIARASIPQETDDANGDPFEHKTGVLLATIHAAKGLQTKAAFVVDVTAAAFPPPDPEKPQDPRALEAQRLFYVASSRATDRLYYCWDTFDRGGKEATTCPYITLIAHDTIDAQRLAAMQFPEIDQHPDSPIQTASREFIAPDPVLEPVSDEPHPLEDTYEALHHQSNDHTPQQNPLSATGDPGATTPADNANPPEAHRSAPDPRLEIRQAPSASPESADPAPQAAQPQTASPTPDTFPITSPLQTSVDDFEDADIPPYPEDSQYHLSIHQYSAMQAEIPPKPAPPEIIAEPPTPAADSNAGRAPAHTEDKSASGDTPRRTDDPADRAADPPPHTDDESPGYESPDAQSPDAQSPRYESPDDESPDDDEDPPEPPQRPPESPDEPPTPIPARGRSSRANAPPAQISTGDTPPPYSLEPNRRL